MSEPLKRVRLSNVTCDLSILNDFTENMNINMTL